MIKTAPWFSSSHWDNSYISDVLIDENLNRLLLSSFGEDEVYVLDLTTGREIKKLASSDGPGGMKKKL